MWPGRLCASCCTMLARWAPHELLYVNIYVLAKVLIRLGAGGVLRAGHRHRRRRLVALSIKPVDAQETYTMQRRSVHWAQMRTAWRRPRWACCCGALASWAAPKGAQYGNFQ